jgi:hypothetical protein
LPPACHGAYCVKRLNAATWWHAEQVILFERMKDMQLSEVFPPEGHIQDLYCDTCAGHLDLAYADFSEDVSGINIAISGLPVLRCEVCKRDHLPDGSRFAIIRIHEKALKAGSSAVKVTRRKPDEQFSFTKLPFLYDSDDYRYILYDNQLLAHRGHICPSERHNWWRWSRPRRAAWRAGVCVYGGYVVVSAQS